jgi:RNA polymerase sigma-70 factor (ECF subfamily)
MGVVGRWAAAHTQTMSAAPQLAEDLFNEYSRRIYAYCLRQLGSPEEAEDALQATYLNACRSLLNGFEPEVAQAWLFKVAENVCLTRQRSTWRRSRVERPQDLQAVQDFVAAPEETGEQLLGIADALATLSGQQRRAILLREWQGLSYREVAAEMGISQGAVETLIFRARRALVSALEQPAEVPTRRTRLAHAFDGGALLASFKAALAGSLSTSVVTGLAVAASTTVIATSTVGHADSLRPSATPRVAPAKPELTSPALRIAAPDRELSSVARVTSAGKAKGKGHRHGKPAHAGKNHGRGHGSHGGGKPPWAGGGGGPEHSQAGGNGGGQGRG